MFSLCHGNSLVTETAGDQPAIPRLRRVLTLWDLIFYGIVVIQPIAAVPLFGIGQKLSNGHMVTTILIAMLAMMLTASSYGRMASLYPVAGSAYTYVGRGLNAHLGFVTGWLIFLDYLIVPVTGIIYSSLTVQRVLTPFLPQLPPRLLFALLASFFAAAITALNLRGIRSAAKANIGLLFIMSVVIVLFMGSCNPLPLPPARLGGSLLLGAVLRFPDLSPSVDRHRHFLRGAHLYRFR